ncbi:hypothetical protein VCHA53O466_50524 [Vibrio chagasii]|nr:hypothetical protein VCHA53O466_50524 [Vibrio chagasii]
MYINIAKAVIFKNTPIRIISEQLFSTLKPDILTLVEQKVAKKIASLHALYFDAKDNGVNLDICCDKTSLDDAFDNAAYRASIKGEQGNEWDLTSKLLIKETADSDTIIIVKSEAYSDIILNNLLKLGAEPFDLCCETPCELIKERKKIWQSTLNATQNLKSGFLTLDLIGWNELKAVVYFQDLVNLSVPSSGERRRLLTVEAEVQRIMDSSPSSLGKYEIKRQVTGKLSSVEMYNKLSSTYRINKSIPDY